LDLRAEMEIAISASLSAERYVNVNSTHTAKVTRLLCIFFNCQKFVSHIQFGEIKSTRKRVFLWC